MIVEEKGDREVTPKVINGDEKKMNKSQIVTLPPMKSSTLSIKVKEER